MESVFQSEDSNSEYLVKYWDEGGNEQDKTINVKEVNPIDIKNSYEFTPILVE